VRRTPYKRPVITVKGKGKTSQQLVSRVVMEKRLGRPLISAEIVHHINGDPFDNRIENLQLTTRSEHMKHHLPEILKAFREVVPLKLPADEIVKLFETQSAIKIAKLYGCSPVTIIRVLHSVLGNVSLRKKATHCKHGHEFTPDNTHVYPNGQHECRTCRRKISKAAYWRRKNRPTSTSRLTL